MTVIGIDVGGTKVLGLTLDDSGAPMGQPRREPTPRHPARLLDPIAAMVLDAGASAVGVGIPGLVTREGALVVGPNLQGIGHLDVAGGLRSRLHGVFCVVDNDANCATRAEARVGVAAGAGEMVCVTLGTGIGGGLVTGGVLQRGANGFAGEPGHMIIDPHGPPCPCGRRGCWERYASGSGLGRLGREAAESGQAPGLVDRAGGDPEAVRGEHVTALAAEGDPGALAVMEEFGYWLALGIANLVHLLDPEMVVVGGGLAEASATLLPPARRAFAGLLLAADVRAPVAIEAAALGERAGAVGAGLLALEAAHV